MSDVDPNETEGSVLILSRYGLLGASSRVRFFQYLPYLRAAGLKTEVQSLLPDDYLRRRYGGKGVSMGMVAGAYCSRLGVLLRRNKSEVIWLEKELWPFIPFGVEKTFLAGRKYVVDIDDAVFHNYDEHRSSVVKYVLGTKLDSLFRGAALVTAGNSYLARRAAEAGAPWIEVLPTVVNFNEYQLPQRAETDEFIVGWIGSPATQHLLGPVQEALSDVLNEHGSRFVTIGSAFRARLFERHEEWPWRRNVEAHEVSKLDVGIMPVPDGPFERGKCGYKLIQYMACGVPVIASPVGANVQIVRHGENGFLAETQDDWRRALIALRTNADLRRRMGEAGRRMVRAHYSYEVTAPKLVDWLARVSGRSGLVRAAQG